MADAQTVGISYVEYLSGRLSLLEIYHSFNDRTIYLYYPWTGWPSLFTNIVPKVSAAAIKFVLHFVGTYDKKSL